MITLLQLSYILSIHTFQKRRVWIEVEPNLGRLECVARGRWALSTLPGRVDLLSFLSYAKSHLLSYPLWPVGYPGPRLEWKDPAHIHLRDWYVSVTWEGQSLPGSRSGEQTRHICLLKTPTPDLSLSGHLQLEPLRRAWLGSWLGDGFSHSPVLNSCHHQHPGLSPSTTTFLYGWFLPSLWCISFHIFLITGKCIGHKHIVSQIVIKWTRV